MKTFCFTDGIATVLAVAVCTIAHGIRAQDAETPGGNETASAPSAETAAPVTLKTAEQLIEEYDLPTVTEGPPVTLAEALKAANANNPSLAAVRTGIEEAQAKEKAAWGAVLPYVYGEMGYTVRDHADTVNFGDSLSGMFPAGVEIPDTGEMVITNRQDLNGSLKATMPIFNFQSWVRIRVAKDAVELSRLSAEEVRRQLLLNAAEIYFRAMAARKLIEMQLATMASLVQHLAVAEARFNAGAGLRIDVIRAQTDLSDAKQQIIAANLAFDNARDALSRLTGIEGLPMPTDEPEIAVPEGDEEAQQRSALTQRPDILAADASVELNRRMLRESRSQFLPTLNAFWQGSYQFTDTGDLGSSDKSRMIAVFTLMVPLYNHARYGDLDMKRAALRRSEFEREARIADVSMNVRKARRDYASSLTSVTVAEQGETLAQEALTLTHAAYSGGAGSSLDVTDAMRTVMQADINLATKRLESQITLLRLLYAVGEDMSSVDK